MMSAEEEMAEGHERSKFLNNDLRAPLSSRHGRQAVFSYFYYALGVGKVDALGQLIRQFAGSGTDTTKPAVIHNATSNTPKHLRNTWGCRIPPSTSCVISGHEDVNSFSVLPELGEIRKRDDILYDRLKFGGGM